MASARAKAATLTDPHGRPLRLGHAIGRGGEGEVFAIEGAPGLLAKLYHEPMSRERQRKIEVLAGMHTPELEAVCALPTGLLRRNGAAAGILMPFMSGRNELHELHGPQSRCVKFPAASFPFVVHVSCNVARAFAVLHEARILVGDVNDRGTLVGQDGTVRLIDCDSFQVTTLRETYPCEVGVPEYTPPELQGTNLRGLVRTEHHEAFSVAVLLFRLLVMGRHPFAGRCLGGSIELEEAIADCRYAYAADAKRTQMVPPPKTLPVAALVGAEIAELFERAFSPCAKAGENKYPRPSAKKWVEALERLRRGLVDCHLNGAHAHLKGPGSCPWCELEQAYGTDLFNFIMPPAGVAIAIDIEQIWKAVGALAVPTVPEAIEMAQVAGLANPSAPMIHPRQAELAQLVDEARRARQYAASCTRKVESKRLGLGQLQLDKALAERRLAELEIDLTRKQRKASSWVATLASLFGSSVKKKRDEALAEAQREFERARTEELNREARVEEDARRLMALKDCAESEEARALALADVMEDRAAALKGEIESARVAAIASADHRLAEAGKRAAEARKTLAELKSEANALKQRLAEIRRALGTLRADWLQLATAERSAIAHLVAMARNDRLRRHLAQHFIANAEISGITRTLKVTLASYGIETAVDIDNDRVDAVPGFGPKRTKAMLDWRDGVARSFRPPASLGPDPKTLKDLEQRFAVRKYNVARHFPKARAQLEESVLQLAARVARAKAAADDAVRTYAQARVDRRML